MDIKRLEAFLAVARRGSFTLAARDLGRSQPTLSRQVRELEDDLGLALFERLGKAVHLTEAGRHLQVEGARLQGDVERIEEHLRDLAGVERGRLRLGAGTTPGLYVVPSLLARLMSRFPDVDLHYSITNSAAVGRSLLANELDVGFVGRRLEHRCLDHRELVEDDIICVASPAHPLAGRTVVVADLAHCTQIVREPGSATRAHVDAALTAAGVLPRRRIELAGPEAVKAVVQAGLGVAWLSSLAVAGELARGELVRLDVAGVSPKRDIYLVIHLDKRLTPVLRQLLAVVSCATW